MGSYLVVYDSSCNVMMRTYYTKFGLLLLLVKFAQCVVEEDNIARDEKLISTFQIVRFPNDVCVGSSSRNGTCYTSAECSDKGGTSSGSCADGFGVCCTFLITTCGSSSSENITYWTQPSAGIASGVQSDCKMTVCPMSDEICSLRLDFTTFVITGPNTISLFMGTARYGSMYYVDYLDNAIAGLRGGITYSTNCMYDEFMANGPSASSNPPAICGTNTGMHMYLEADTDACNQLSFSFADGPQTTTTATNTRGLTTLATRKWDITITQIECTSPTNPPVGCTQYFWGGEATISNYNFQSTSQVTTNQGIHLANQHQRICIRRERGYCYGCFSTSAAGFQVSGPVLLAGNFAYPGGSCGYMDVPGGGHLVTEETGFHLGGLSPEAEKEQVATGFDCVIIPGAFISANDETTGGGINTQTAAVIRSQGTENGWRTPTGPQISGGGAGIGIGGTTVTGPIEGTGTVVQDDLVITPGASITVCTTHEPFTLEFMSDDLEGYGAVDAAEENNELNSVQLRNRGFSILHEQISCS